MAKTAAVFLKVFPLVVAPALLRAGRWGRIAVAAAVGLLLAANAPHFARRPESLSQLVDANFGRSLATTGLDAGNHGLVYLLAMSGAFATGEPLREIPALLRVGSVLLLLATASWVLMKRGDLVLGGAALILAQVLTYPHTWEHHYSGVVVAALAAATRIEGRRTLAALLVATVVIALPTPFVLLDRARDPRVWDPSTAWPPIARLVLPAAKAVPTALVFVLLLASRRPEARAA